MSNYISLIIYIYYNTQLFFLQIAKIVSTTIKNVFFLVAFTTLVI